MSADTWQAHDGETYRGQIYATLETAHFLAEWGEVDSDLQKGFESFEPSPDGSWFEDSQEFMASKGFVQVCRDNIYNAENELSQVYVWEVYLPASECDSEGNYNGDTIYADDAVTVFYIHTGADVRGGYGPPVFMRTQGDYNYPVDVVSSFYAVEGRREGADLAWEDLANISEEWQAGYHSLPSSQVSKEVARIFGFTQTPTSVCVLLNSGELVKVECCVPIS